MIDVVTNNGDIEFIIIHLSRNTERAKHVDSLKASLPLSTEVLDATDSANLSAEALNCYQLRQVKPYYPFVLNKGEIACFISHRRAWQRIVDKQLKGAFVCEDDIVINPAQLQSSVALVQQQNFTVVRFPDITRRPKKAIETVASSSDKTIAMQRTAAIGLGMQLTYVSREAAEQLLAVTEVFDRPIDTYLQLISVHQVDILTCNGVKVEDISSILGGSEVGAKKKNTFLTKVSKEILRPIYKWQVQRATDRYLENKKRII
jgi:GR25 family glycosyltransferase involved in LPS biosynthesis